MDWESAPEKMEDISALPLLRGDYWLHDLPEDARERLDAILEKRLIRKIAGKSGRPSSDGM